MTLKYYLKPFALNKEEELYVAVPKPEEILSFDDLVNRMEKRGTGITRVDIIACMSLYQEVVMSELSKGNTVNTPLFRIGINMEGLYPKDDAHFDKNLHTIGLSIQPNKEMKGRVAGIRPKRVIARPKTPDLRNVVNLSNRSLRKEFYAGDALKVKGSFLYYDKADIEQGLFLVLDSKTSIHMEEILEATPSSILFRLPSNLTPGSCSFEFRGCTRKGKPVNQGSLLIDCWIL